MHYLTTIQPPFKGIDLNDAEAVAAAHKKAIELGKPLSAELKGSVRRTICKRIRGLSTYTTRFT